LELRQGGESLVPKRLRFFLAVLVLADVFASSATAAEKSQRTVKLRSGSIVAVKAMEQLSGSTLQAGQEVALVVSMPLVVDGVTVIAAGTGVSAYVQDAKENGMAGIAGALVVALRNTTTVDGTTVPLTGQLIAKGDDQVGRNVAVGVILCPFILLDKGGHAVIPAGAETRGMTIGDFDVRAAEN